MDGVLPALLYQSLILSFLMRHLHSQVVPKADIYEYCKGETFEANCAPDQAVIMTHANYGRMREGRCASYQFGHFGCYQPVLDRMDRMCSGLQNCTVRIGDFEYADIRPCPLDVSSYLEAAYTCVDVEGFDGGASCGSGTARVTDTSGYLSSHVTSVVGVGAHSCPWEISLSPGQRVNLTLYDFSSAAAYREQGEEADTRCIKVGRIYEGSSSKQLLLCDMDERIRVEYLSTSSTVTVEMFHNPDVQSDLKFLLKYQAVGCADPPQVAHAQVRRDGVSTSVACTYSAGRWRLVCDGSRWVGRVGNCTAPVSSEETGVWMVLFGEDWSTPTGILIVVGFGVALGVVIGISLLGCAVLFMKRCMEPDTSTRRPSGAYSMGMQIQMGKVPPSPDPHLGYHDSLVGPAGSSRGYSDSAYQGSTLGTWSRDSEAMSTGKGSVQGQFHIYETPDTMVHVSSAPVL